MHNMERPATAFRSDIEDTTETPEADGRIGELPKRFGVVAFWLDGVRNAVRPVRPDDAPRQRALGPLDRSFAGSGLSR